MRKKLSNMDSLYGLVGCSLELGESTRIQLRIHSKFFRGEKFFSEKQTKNM
jgi:hypothetical protein